MGGGAQRRIRSARERRRRVSVSAKVLSANDGIFGDSQSQTFVHRSTITVAAVTTTTITTTSSSTDIAIPTHAYDVRLPQGPSIRLQIPEIV